MFLPAFLNGRNWAARRCVQRAAHWRTLFPLLFLPGSCLPTPTLADATSLQANELDSGAGSCSAWCWPF